MISVCIIAKNEEKNIRKCIECILKYGFEIIVLDTGSSDATVDIVKAISEKNRNVKLFHFEWCNDFSVAKNEAIAKASNDMVLIIDADEFVEKIDLPQLNVLINSNKKKVGRIKRINVFTRNSEKMKNQEWINRIFSKTDFHYEGRIHEQVTGYYKAEYDTYLAPITIIHTGYDLSEQELELKAQRNIKLLEDELNYLLTECNCEDISLFEGKKPKKGTVEPQIPYILYQLGKSYYMAKKFDKAVFYFEKGLYFDLEPKLEYVIDMVETYGYALINEGKAREALLLEGVYDEFGDCADFKLLMGLIYMNNEMFDEAVNEFLKATEYKTCRNSGANSYSAFYNIGVIYECLGYGDEARAFYKKCGDYKPAIGRLQMLSC